MKTGTNTSPLIFAAARAMWRAAVPELTQIACEDLSRAFNLFSKSFTEEFENKDRPQFFKEDIVLDMSEWSIKAMSEIWSKPR